MTKILKNRETCAKFVRHLWQNRRFPHRIPQNFAAHESNGTNSVWNSNVQKLPHKMPLIWTRIARMERTVFETLMFKNCFTKMPLIWTWIARMERTVQDLMRKLMKRLMNINGEKNVQREKCSAPMASNRRRNLLSLKRGRYARFFS